MRAIGYSLVATSLSAIGSIACAESRAGYYKVYLRDGHKIEITVDDREAAAYGHYEILISRGDDLATRLSGKRAGRVTMSWITDLNHNGDFEVVIAMRDRENNSSAIRIFEWNDLFLQSLEPQPPPNNNALDRKTRYGIVDDKLTIENLTPADNPLEQQRYWYNFDSATWVKL